MKIFTIRAIILYGVPTAGVCLLFISALHLHFKKRWKELPSVMHLKGESNEVWCSKLKDYYPVVTNYSEILSQDREDPDDNRTVNIFPFEYVYSPHKLCGSQTKIYILSIVKSKVDNIKLRTAIRKTWGRDAKSRENRMVFLLGSSEDENVQENVHREAFLFKDTVQGDFVDDYYSNTYKTSMGIRWMSRYCAHARFVIIVDDDVVINFKNVENYYSKIPQDKEQGLYSGHLKPYDIPFRNTGSKWYMPESKYPYDCYPQYISGCIVLTSGPAVRMLHRAMPYVKKFRYDDVYFGIVAQKVGIVPQKNDLVSIEKVSPDKIRYMIASHGYPDPVDYMKMYSWTDTTASTNRSSS